MDATFSSPAPLAPIPRPRPVNTQKAARESNALRASVFDVALELGITNNSLVAEWMFNNTLEEEDEEFVSSPGLTHNSSVASEDASPQSQYPSTPPDQNSFPSSFSILPTSGKPVAGWNPSKINDLEIPYLSKDPSGSSTGTFAFPAHGDIPIPTRPVTPNGAKKLRKKTREGYESDGGYLSETGKKSKAIRELEKKESKARLKEEKKERKEEERRRKKSLGSLAKANKKADGGYETDGAAASSSKSPFKSKKSKTKNPSTEAAAYETDAGYHSSGSNLKKSTRGFFKLGSKSSRANLREDAAHPVPQLEKLFVPLPIAERFATSLGDNMPPNANLKASAPLLNSTATERPPQLPQPAPSSPDDTFTVAFDSAAAAVSAPSHQDRSSLSSAESSSSMGSSHRRLGLQFLPSHDGSSHGHGPVRESISTLNSSSHGSSFHYAPQSIESAQPLSSLPTSASSMPSTSARILKPPSISYPLTRATSPASPLPPVAPLSISKLRGLPQLDLNSGGPLPLSPNSAHVATTPSLSNAPSPILPVPPPVQSPPLLRPRNPPVDGFGPRSSLAPRSPSATGRLSPNPILGRRLTPLTIQPDPNLSSDPSTFQSPKVLAYYDIPPPSPPPAGPLPSVPPGVGPNSAASHLRSRVLERQRNGNELSTLSNQHIQRGRESPFPVRPLGATSNPNVGSPMALEAGGRVPRQTAPGPPSMTLRQQQEMEMFYPREQMGRTPRGDAVDRDPQWVDSWIDSDSGHLAYDDGDEEGVGMDDVLERFTDSSLDSHEADPEGDARVLEARRSFEALRQKQHKFDISDYDAPNETIYAWDNSRNRESRWSGSIYSRASILDPDQSEEARERFVKLVEAMADSGRGNDSAIPPVPRIPEGLANANSWNKF